MLTKTFGGDRKISSYIAGFWVSISQTIDLRTASFGHGVFQGKRTLRHDKFRIYCSCLLLLLSLSLTQDCIVFSSSLCETIHCRRERNCPLFANSSKMERGFIIECNSSHCRWDFGSKAPSIFVLLTIKCVYCNLFKICCLFLLFLGSQYRETTLRKMGQLELLTS